MGRNHSSLLAINQVTDTHPKEVTNQNYTDFIVINHVTIIYIFWWWCFFCQKTRFLSKSIYC